MALCDRQCEIWWAFDGCRNFLLKSVAFKKKREQKYFLRSAWKWHGVDIWFNYYFDTDTEAPKVANIFSVRVKVDFYEHHIKIAEKLFNWKNIFAHSILIVLNHIHQILFNTLKNRKPLIIGLWVISWRFC